ncbi:MAG TPA: DUF2231 domain-containing protein [Gemmatimonadales bacterium]
MMRAWRTRGPAAPLHPILVHFTIALTSSSLLFDTLGRVLAVSSLGDAAWWTLAAALPATLGAIVSGVTSRRRLPMEEGEARSWLRAHMALGPVFAGLLVAVAFWRGAARADGAPVSWSYLAALGVVVAVMAVQGYLGGELVYRFGAEVRGWYRRLPDETLPRTARPRDARARTV